MLIFILPSFALALLVVWAAWLLYGVWRVIPKSNSDFEVAGGNYRGNRSPRNPAETFYADSGIARLLGAALRMVDAVAPALGTGSALRLFFTPLPWKLTARRSVLPGRWTMTTWSFESVRLAAYRQRGLEPGRPVVLLVHGWAGSGAQMATLGDALATAGYDPVLLDFPAHGRSGGWRSTLPQFSRALFLAVARLGPLHAIVAHSLGAVATVHAAARGLAVERLILVAPSAPPAMFLRWFAGAFGLSETVPERMQQRIEACEAIRLEEFEPEWLGARIVQPTLVIHDEGDRVAPHATAERLVAELQAARLHSTRGLGHRRILDDEAVARVVMNQMGS